MTLEPEGGRDGANPEVEDLLAATRDGVGGVWDERVM